MRLCRFDILSEVIKYLYLQLKVIVCGDKIGWRQGSRRVVVYTTDQVSRVHICDII